MKYIKHIIVLLFCFILLLITSCGNVAERASVSEGIDEAFAAEVAAEEANWRERYEEHLQRNPDSSLSYREYLSDIIPKIY